MIDNLTIIKASLKEYLCNYSKEKQSIGTANNINVNSNNSNKIILNITFKQEMQNIDGIVGLTDSDTDKMKDKIDELKNI